MAVCMAMTTRLVHFATLGRQPKEYEYRQGDERSAPCYGIDKAYNKANHDKEYIMVPFFHVTKIGLIK